MSLALLGRVCTSSAKFQENLFEENAVPHEFPAVGVLPQKLTCRRYEETEIMFWKV